jgi:hypothetical protein
VGAGAASKCTVYFFLNFALYKPATPVNTHENSQDTRNGTCLYFSSIYCIIYTVLYHGRSESVSISKHYWEKFGTLTYPRKSRTIFYLFMQDATVATEHILKP